MTLGGTDGFGQGPSGYFLIIDRLSETLDQRIKKWSGADNLSHNLTRSAGHKRCSLFFKRSMNNTLKHSSTASAESKVLTPELKQEEMDERLNVGEHVSFFIHFASSSYNTLNFTNLSWVHISSSAFSCIEIFAFAQNHI